MKGPRKIPMRRCIATGEQCPKKELIRIVRTPEGSIVIDPTGKANGRGAYLKKDATAFETAKKKRLLQRALEVEIDDSLFDQLNALLQD